MEDFMGDMDSPLASRGQSSPIPTFENLSLTSRYEPNLSGLSMPSLTSYAGVPAEDPAIVVTAKDLAEALKSKNLQKIFDIYKATEPEAMVEVAKVINDRKLLPDGESLQQAVSALGPIAVRVIDFRQMRATRSSFMNKAVGIVKDALIQASECDAGLMIVEILRGFSGPELDKIAAQFQRDTGKNLLAEITSAPTFSKEKREIARGMLEPEKVPLLLKLVNEGGSYPAISNVLSKMTAGEIGQASLLFYGNHRHEITSKDPNRPKGDLLEKIIAIGEDYQKSSGRKTKLTIREEVGIVAFPKEAINAIQINRGFGEPDGAFDYSKINSGSWINGADLAEAERAHWFMYGTGFDDRCKQETTQHKEGLGEVPTPQHACSLLTERYPGVPYYPTRKHFLTNPRQKELESGVWPELMPAAPSIPAVPSKVKP